MSSTKYALHIMFTAVCVCVSESVEAAEYQLRVESKEAAKGYVSLQIFRKRKSCQKAIDEYQPKYPGRELVCVKLKSR